MNDNNNRQKLIEKIHKLEEKNQQLKKENDRLKASNIAYNIPSETNFEKQILSDPKIFSTCMDNVQGSVFIKDNTSRTLYVNQHMKERFGAKNWKDKLPEEIFPKQTVKLIRKTDRKALQEGYHKFEETIPGKEGKDYTYLTHKFKIELDDKRPLIGGVAIDISELKKPAQKLLNIKKKLQATLNSIGDAVISTDTKGRIVHMNPVAEQLTGWKNEESHGQSIQDVFKITNAKTGKIVKNPVDKVMEEGQIMGLANHTVLISKTGHKYHIADSASPIKDKADNIIGVVLIFRDMTEQYQNRQKLKEHERFLDSIFNAIQDGISVLDTNLNIKHVNNTMKKWYADSMPLSGKKCYQFYHNRNTPCSPCPTLKCIQTGKTEREIVRGPSGSDVKWIELFSYPIKNPETGEVESVVEFVRDITSSKKAQYELKQSEENLRMTLNSIGDAVISTDIEGKIVRMNPVAEQLTGWKKEDAKDKSINNIFKIVNANTRQKVKNPVDDVLEKGHKVGLANHTILIAKDGQEYQIADSGAPIKDEKGNINGVVLVFRDVTEEYKMRESLKRSESKYKAIFKNTGTATIIIEDDTTISLANQKFEELSGYSKAEIEGKKSWTEFVVHDDLKKMEKYHKKRRENTDNVANQYEFRFIDKDKIQHEILLLVDTIPGTRKSVASLLDITEQKQTHRELEDHLKEMRLITNMVVETSRNENIDAICQSISETIHSLNSNSYVVVTLYDPELEAIRIQTMHGFQRYIDLLFEIYGEDISNINIDPSEMGEYKDLYKTGKLEYIPGGLYTLMEQKIPKVLCRGIEKLMNIGKTYSVGFALDEQPYGGITIFLQQGETTQYKSAIETIANHFSVIIKRKHAEAALRKSQERLQLALEGANGGLWDWNLQNDKVIFSEQWAQILGYELDDLEPRLETWEKLVHPDDIERVMKELEAHIEGETPFYETEYRMQAKDGSWKWILDRGKVLEWNEKGDPKRAVGTHLNITELKKSEREREKLQKQLLQTQKLESIGTLAGGVAHDFNNILTVIIGLSELIMVQTEKSDTIHDHLESIYESAKRAAKLTRQLLIFSRKQDMEFERVNLNSTIYSINKMLKRLIGEDITMETQFDKDLWQIEADESQIEQVITNLAVNARDAMPEGGTLRIKTQNVVIDAEKAQSIPDIEPGEYVRLTMEDTGIGIDKSIQEKIFDPFFTTKGRAEGTGMGLSVVHGIVKKHQGLINVYSEPGEGTIFRIYLPAVKQKDHKTAIKTETENIDQYHGKGQTVLIVEDEKPVLKYLESILGNYGYNYLSATSGEEALEIFKKEKDKIDLLISDVIMTGIDGVELADKLKNMNKNLSIILSSGYSDRKVVKSEIKERGYKFIQKPYESITLLKLIQKTL